jgi:diacylglycerol kinase (ATP)
VPDQPATLILNPYAGRWNAGAMRDEIERELRAAGITCTAQISEERGHATQLARQAVEQGATLVIAAGGDGTVNQVVNGIARAAHGQAALGVVPVGTGNDFATMLDLPLDLPGACRRIAAGGRRAVDLGRVTWENGMAYFDNNSGMGLEAMVTLENDRLVHLKGKLRYIVAALLGIARYRPWEVTFEFENGRYHGPVALISVGNTRRTGGVFYLTPHAVPDDGQLDFLSAHTPSRLRLMQLLPMAMQGKHIHEPEMTLGRAPRLRLTWNPPTPIQCDGEVVTENARQIEYELIPGGLIVAG